MTQNNSLPHVVMLIWHYHPFIGGAERQCQRLSKCLVEQGVKVSVITERSEGFKKTELIDNIVIHRVFCFWYLRKISKIIGSFIRKINKSIIENKSDDIAIKKHSLISSIAQFTSFSLPIYSFVLSSLLKLYCMRKDYDIIHVHEAHWSALIGVLAGKLFNKKVIIKESSSKLTYLLLNNLQNLRHLKGMIKNAHIIAVSDDIKLNLMREGFDESRIYKIPNGINIHSMKEEKTHIKNEVIFIGNLYQGPIKGIDILLEAFSIVLKTNKDVRLLIFGQGDETPYKQIVERLQIKDKVVFCGFISDIEKFLTNAAVFVLPSRQEGMSNSLLEAMELGIPCVSTDVSGSKDLIKNGINGLLVPVEDIGALANAITYMFENRQEAIKMGIMARKTVEEDYDIKVIAHKYIQLYQNLLNS